MKESFIYEITGRRSCYFVLPIFINVTLIKLTKLTESLFRMKGNLKVWKFWAQPRQNRGPLIFFAQLNENTLLLANIFQLQIYQKLFLVNMGNIGSS